jgi:hypothetical protein
LPACDVSNQGQTCQFSEGRSVCLDGKWFGCGFAQDYCRDPSRLPPEGALCCYMSDFGATIFGPFTCCAGGIVASCDGNPDPDGGRLFPGWVASVMYHGACEQLDGGNSQYGPWNYRVLLDGAPDAETGAGCGDACIPSADAAKE